MSRHVLTRIETLPEAAVPATQQAYDAIKNGRATQLQALRALNERLAAIGIEPVSRSGLNRWVERIHSGEAKRPRANAEDQKMTASELNPDIRAAVARLLRTLADQVENDGLV